MRPTWGRSPTPWLGVFVAVAIASGCNDGPRMARVNGTVSAGGQPLADAGVTFTPLEGGRPAWATTDKQGRFALTTLKGGDGALVGEHVVTIAERGVDVPQMPKGVDADTASLIAELPTAQRRSNAGGLIDPIFASRSTSTLRYTVESGVSNVADFDLTN